jgi:hypothetical protein
MAAGGHGCGVYFRGGKYAAAPIKQTRLDEPAAFGVLKGTFKNFGRVLACAVFNCACKLRWFFIWQMQ